MDIENLKKRWDEWRSYIGQPYAKVVDFVDGVNHLSDMEEAIEQIDELISRLAAAERVVKAIRAVVDEQGGLLVAGGYGLRDKAQSCQAALAAYDAFEETSA